MTQASAENKGRGLRPPAGEPESLYERFPWLYAFCRDHLFRNDTEKIVAALWPAGAPAEGSNLLELGCGPGFYARRLATRFGHLRVTGIDRSARQLRRAHTHAAARRLRNCTFEEGERVIEEMHRVLRPGGRCFVAEPRSALRAAVPLRALRLRARLSDLHGGPGSYREPGEISVMTSEEFGGLICSQPWSATQRWQDTWYQYAVCEKGPERDCP